MSVFQNGVGRRFRWRCVIDDHASRRSAKDEVTIVRQREGVSLLHSNPDLQRRRTTGHARVRA